MYLGPGGSSGLCSPLGPVNAFRIWDVRVIMLCA